jgi:hypothetical protein
MAPSGSMQRYLYVLGMACAIAGCMPMNQASAVRESFATAYTCPKQHVSVHGDDSDAPFEAKGCGHHEVYSCVDDKLTDKLMGAIRCRPIQDIATSAAADVWRCSPGELAATQDAASTVDAQRFAVSGCGRRATVACHHYAQQVTQVVEGDEHTGIELRWECRTHDEGMPVQPPTPAPPPPPPTATPPPPPPATPMP